MKYVALLRGVNVGGKNKIAMSELKVCLEKLGYDNVTTYINSGNVLFSSSKTSAELAEQIEEALVKGFKFDSELIKVLVLSDAQLEKVIQSAPKGFGTHSETYHSDAVFLIGQSVESAIGEFEIHPEVDRLWEGQGMVYFQRLSAKRTKSRLSKIVMKPIYKSMTIRSWNTVLKLQQRLESLTD